MVKNIILISLDGFRKDKIELSPALKSIKENSYVMVLMVTTKCSISKKMK